MAEVYGSKDWERSLATGLGRLLPFFGGMIANAVTSPGGVTKEMKAVEEVNTSQFYNPNKFGTRENISMVSGKMPSHMTDFTTAIGDSVGSLVNTALSMFGMGGLTSKKAVDTMPVMHAPTSVTGNLSGLIGKTDRTLEQATKDFNNLGGNLVGGGKTKGYNFNPYIVPKYDYSNSLKNTITDLPKTITGFDGSSGVGGVGNLDVQGILDQWSQKYQWGQKWSNKNFNL